MNLLVVMDYLNRGMVKNVTVFQNYYNFGSRTCGDYGGPPSVVDLLRCNKECKIDGILCESPLCGNGNQGLGEMCAPTENNGDTCSLGCYGPEQGASKSCKCMCTNDIDCQGPGRANVVCEEGVCRGCGDGDLKAGEQCDDTSVTNTQVACTNLFSYTPKGAVGWLCNSCNCLDSTLSIGGYWCPVGKKTIPNRPVCTNDRDCARGEVCNNNCVCESNKKNLCVSAGVVKNIFPKTPECTEGSAASGVLAKDCKDRDKECKNCKCVYTCNGVEVANKPQCNDKIICPDGKSCNLSTCKCEEREETYCGNNVVETPNSAGVNEQCDPPGSQCTRCASNSGTCQSDCSCYDNCGDYRDSESSRLE